MEKVWIFFEGQKVRKKYGSFSQLLEKIMFYPNQKTTQMYGQIESMKQVWCIFRLGFKPNLIGLDRLDPVHPYVGFVYESM